jgi:hypothetical protein
LPRSEVLLSELLGQAGYDTALVSDNPQLLKRDYHYDRSFATRIRIRGQIKGRLRCRQGARHAALRAGEGE